MEQYGIIKIEKENSKTNSQPWPTPIHLLGELLKTLMPRLHPKPIKSESLSNFEAPRVILRNQG